MESFLEQHLNDQTSWLILLPVIAVSLAVLGKAADWLVHAAVALSLRSGLPKVIIGATIVSLGTTSPEVAVSVTAAIQGNPGLALGNAVGSIICDTALILGLACVIAPLPLDRKLVHRQGWLQVGAGVLLVLSAWPLTAPLSAFRSGGNLPQFLGFFFLVLLAGYLWLSVRWARDSKSTDGLPDEEREIEQSHKPAGLLIAWIVGSLALVILSSVVLIPAVKGSAVKIGVPQSIISATLVAFGTSLPELVTAVMAARRGHGDIALGNVIGADILNVLSVAGASAAVTPGGLDAEPHFFFLLFPVMLVVLGILRCGIQSAIRGDAKLRRPFGIVLLVAYGVYLVLGAVTGIQSH